MSAKFMVFLVVLSILSAQGCATYRTSHTKATKKADELPLTVEGIMDAASRGDVDKVRKILKQKPFLVNAKNANGATPLHMAANPLSSGPIRAFGNYPETVSLLLNSGAEVNTKDNDGSTPLHDAAYFQGWDTTRERITIKGRIVYPGELATEIIRLLISNGADLEAKSEGNAHATPLHHAAAHGLKEAVVVLVQSGADINARLSAGGGRLTPLDVARLSDRLDVVNFLKSHGAKGRDQLQP
jgi:ankyrin repeat protein